MILPNGIENLSVAGRCASCDDDAIQTVRIDVYKRQPLYLGNVAVEYV